MSIVVSNGVKFRGVIFSDLDTKLQTYRDKYLVPTLKRDFYRQIALDLCAVHDISRYLNLEAFWPNEKDLYSAALDKELSRRAHFRTVNEPRLLFELTVFNSNEGYLLGQRVCSPKIWDHFLQHSGIVCENWNCTSKVLDASITQEDLDWNRIYCEGSEFNTRATRGWTIEIVNDTFLNSIPVSHQFIANHLPTKEERISAMASFWCSHNKVKTANSKDIAYKKIEAKVAKHMREITIDDFNKKASDF